MNLKQLIKDQLSFVKSTKTTAEAAKQPNLSEVVQVIFLEELMLS